MEVEIKSEVEDADSLVDGVFDYSSGNADCVDQLGDTVSDEPYSGDLVGANCCKVCGDSATGMYFGALVCVPCKTFFLRYGGDNCTFECKFDRNCEITSTSRTQCKYCRYQKCVQAGMCRKVRPTQVQLNEGQQLCVVCNDVANGVHFGAITCEGCKKFFRRGLSEHLTYSCKNEKRCLVNPRTRNSCRYCRYQKCLSAGMSREAIQMGRPSKVRTSNGSGDGPRAKEPKLKELAEPNVLTNTDEWLKYYTETAMKRDSIPKSNNGLKTDCSVTSSGFRLITNGSRSSIKSILKSAVSGNAVSNVLPVSCTAVTRDNENRSNSSTDEEKDTNFDSFELPKSKALTRLIESYSNKTENVNINKDGQQLKVSDLGNPISTEVDNLSSAVGQYSIKQVSAGINNLGNLFSPAGKWSSSNIPASLELKRALTMSSGGFCQLNSTPSSSVKNAYTEIENKRLAVNYVVSDVALMEFNNLKEPDLKEFSSVGRLSVDDNTKNTDHSVVIHVDEVSQDVQTSQANCGFLRRLNDSLSVNSSSPSVGEFSEMPISIPSESSVSPFLSSPCAVDNCTNHPLLKSTSGFETESSLTPVASSIESMPSFSSPMSDVGLLSPNSTSSRSSMCPSAIPSSRWCQPSDRDSPYCTIFALASSCKLFSEASKNPLEKDEDGTRDKDIFESMCSDNQSRITKHYWLEPVLPDENIIFNEKHLEIINQILSAYERFVQTGTTINETLRKELENWQISNSDMNASLSEWIQIKVVPVYTFSSITYCKSLPGFHEFATKDQATLIRLGQSQSRILVAANHWFDPKERKFHDFLSWRSMDLFKQMLIDYANKIHSLDLDRIESAVLNVLTLIAADFPGLKRPQLIEESRQCILSAFRAYTTAKFGTPNKRLETLFGYIPECRSLGFLHYKMTMTASLKAEEVEKCFPTKQQ